MTASGSLRQQLDGWAVHVAAVRSGNLQVSRELSGLEGFSRAELSPRLDYLALVGGVLGWGGGWGTVTLVPVPAAGAQVDVQQLAKAEDQDLKVPSTLPGRAAVEDIKCAPLRHPSIHAVGLAQSSEHISAEAGRHGAVK